jgi:hypothetical protein
MMRNFVTTVGTAAIIGFAGLGMAASAAAAPVQAPLTTGTISTVTGGFALHGSDANRQADLMRACMERARINGYTRNDLPVAGRQECAANQLP